MSRTGLMAPVIIVGAGPVGLGAALELARFQIPSIVIEQRTSITWHPKARVISTRTMEIARGWGLAVERRLKSIDMPDEWKGRISFITSVIGRQVAQIETPAFVGPEVHISPSSCVLSSQDYLERVLYDAALASDLIDLRFGHEAVRVLYGWRNEDQGAAVEIRDLSTGELRTIEGSAIVAADGVESPIRNQLGIGVEGEKTRYSYVNCYFRADIEKHLRDRRAAIYFYANGAVSGTLQPLDSKGRWLSQISIDPDRTSVVDERQCIEWLHAAVGTPDLPIEILSIGRWRVRATTAERFVAGRVLICGDAAHQLPPTGGLGVNSGFRGIHNAMWKLALVVKGHAGESLLKTYDTEHRPIARLAVDQSLQNQRDVQAIRRAIMTSDENSIVLPDIDLAKHRYGKHFGIEFGSHYDSTAVVADGTSPPDVPDAYSNYIPSARPGHRAPHVWLGHGDGRFSTIDLFGAGFTILAGPDGSAWRILAEAASHQFEIPIGCYVVGGAGLEDHYGVFLDLYKIESDGAVLVRPDGHVAWRAASGKKLGLSELSDALAMVLDAPEASKHAREGRTPQRQRG